MTSEDVRIFTEAEINLLSLDIIQKIRATYELGRDRTVRPESVFQKAVLEGRDIFEEFVELFLLPGSRFEGTENFSDMGERLERGENLIFLPEHRSNFDAPAFHILLRRAGENFQEILDRLVYIAGRKLNESSELVDMFTEKYSRLVIVPKRDLPGSGAKESKTEAKDSEDYERAARRINRAAFRELVRLRRAGKIFVLFPMGGREKPDADNIPVRESTSYLKSFDTAYLVSMEGNALPPRPRMEDERPAQDQVVFRAGRPFNCADFLQQQQEIFERAQSEGKLGDAPDYEQFTVGRIMKLLEQLRTTGDYDPSFPA
ncbi:MAG: hypothetical protein O7G32_06445 [SAR324 cluster bacterium]|nr:hypothetical protein [SAR324 cluster bacterium]